MCQDLTKMPRTYARRAKRTKRANTLRNTLSLKRRECDNNSEMPMLFGTLHDTVSRVYQCKTSAKTFRQKYNRDKQKLVGIGSVNEPMEDFSVPSDNNELIFELKSKNVAENRVKVEPLEEIEYARVRPEVFVKEEPIEMTLREDTSVLVKGVLAFID